MIDKVANIEEVIQFVRDGQTLGLGGMVNFRRPMAFVRALIQRQEPPKNLTLLTLTGGMGADMLVGAGLVNRTRTCYFGLEIFGFAPMFTWAASKGLIEIVEESEASIANGLRAQLAGIGFMPSPAWQGTDMLEIRPDIKSIDDPYTGHRLTAFPAIACDVAVVHVLKADRFGNCVLGGNPTIDFELVSVANTIILTAEEVVDQLPGPIDINGHPVTAVTHCPQGAWPTSCYPCYPIDGEEILRYIEACNQGQFSSYVNSFTA